MRDLPSSTPARYRLLARLGEGSMGVVSRAYDRLTGQEVALKQVSLPPDLTPDEIARELLTLAHEFQLLASLRHPHIISVLDYGADAARQPFYTMELLADATSILQAGQALPMEARVALLLQAAEALAYLHRRGVLHHDLKPANVLVASDRVRVLDFGLSVWAAQQRDDDTFGTLQYLAPEVLQSSPYREAADLYSLGVIAYELFVGRHPFSAQTSREFVNQLLMAPPDLTPLAEAHGGLAAIVGQLLAKDPAERPQAQAVIRALSDAISLPRDESPAVRESYLQAASFVGRAAEMQTLLDTLGRVRQGQGSAVLIGGESGVGKSRLLREVETRALIDGVVVIRGQAAPAGGRDLELWRDPLAHLLVHHTAVDDLAASVLLPYIPNIAELLERPVAPAPLLEGQAAQTRLEATVVRLFQTFERPLLLLLEDLQWAAESLFLLEALLRLADRRPLVILGTYQSDERPELAARLPEMRLMLLERLNQHEVEQLSVAMLGSAGHQPHLLARLQEETEGNTFFLVEIVRALAEDAGQLAAVGQVDLPTRLLPQGIRATITRRLNRVPLEARPLLAFAAVAGRQLDIAVLESLAHGIDVTRWWLPLCAEAGVLEAQGERWHFSHEKLREGFLAQLAGDQLPRLHAGVASALERVYRADDSYAAQLAYHWGQAGDDARELRACLRGGRHARRQGRTGEAMRLFSRALELAPRADAHLMCDLHLQRGAAHEVSGAWTLAEEDYQAALACAERTADLAHAQLALGTLCQLRSEHSPALAWLAQAQANFQATDDRQGLARVHNVIGRVWERQGAYAQARESIQTALSHARKARDDAGIAHALLNLGNVTLLQSEYAQAGALLEEGLAGFRALGDLEGTARALSALGLVAYSRGAYDAAREIYTSCLEQWRAIGHKDQISEALVLLGNVVSAQGDLSAAQAYYQDSLALAREIGNTQRVARVLNNLGSLALDSQDMSSAQQLLEEALALRRALNDTRGVVSSLNNLGSVALHYSDLATAQAQYSESLELGLTIGDLESIAYNLVGMAHLALARDSGAIAARMAAAAIHVLEEIGGEFPADTQGWLVDAAAQARAAVGDAVFQEAWSAGMRMPAADAVRYVLADPFSPPAPRA